MQSLGRRYAISSLPISPLDARDGTQASDENGAMPYLMSFDVFNVWRWFFYSAVGSESGRLHSVGIMNARDRYSTGVEIGATNG